METKIDLISFNLENLKENLVNKIRIKRDHRLIGNWCINHQMLNDSSNKFLTLDFNNWKNIKGKSLDIRNINNIYKKLLKEFVQNLNKTHSKNYSTKYWEFLINRWLLANIVDIYSKWKISEKIISKFFIKKFFYLKLNEKDFIPENTWHHHKMHKESDGLYAHIMFRRIFKYKLKRLNEIELKPKKKNKERKKIEKYQTYKVKSFFNLCLSKKIFMYDLAFDKRIVFFIKLKNLFLNFCYSKKEAKFNSNSPNLRKSFIKLFNTNGNNLESFIKENIFFSFPKIFLENYESLEREYQNLNWMKNPDFIMTTYGHYYDEIFKIYCSKNIINKSKIFIFQHGDGGIYDFNDFYSIGWDEVLSDKYFVWGKNPKKKYKSFYFTKKYLNSKIKFKNNINHKILVTMYGLNEQPFRPLNGHYDNYNANKDLLTNNEIFLNNLKENFKSKVNIKILDNSRHKLVNKYCKKLYKTKNIINAKKNYSKILKKYNLIVHFYLGTPFFESMFYNKPTILILNEKFQLHFDQNFRSLIKKFKKVGICLESPIEASKFVNDNFKNLDDWWNNTKVQSVRNKFCDLYCRNFQYTDDFTNLFKK